MSIAPPSAAGGALYRQIVDAIRREISEGRVGAGAPLPSFRALAEQLLVSLITVKRAYEDLEREGLIVRRQGLGTFASEKAVDRSRALKQAKARELLAEALREAEEAGLSRSEIMGMMKETLKQYGETA